MAGVQQKMNWIRMRSYMNDGGKWLEKDITEGMGVTEIEMQYGVLRSKEELDAYFFIKDGGVDDSDNIEKLVRLRKIIRNNGRYPVEEYDSPQSLGEKVDKAFTEVEHEDIPKLRTRFECAAH